MTNIITRNECALQKQLLEGKKKGGGGGKLIALTLKRKCSCPTCT